MERRYKAYRRTALCYTRKNDQFWRQRMSSPESKTCNTEHCKPIVSSFSPSSVQGPFSPSTHSCTRTRLHTTSRIGRNHQISDERIKCKTGRFCQNSRKTRDQAHKPPELLHRLACLSRTGPRQERKFLEYSRRAPTYACRRWICKERTRMR